MTVKQVAQVLGKTPDAVSKKIQYGKRKADIPADTPHGINDELPENILSFLGVTPGEAPENTAKTTTPKPERPRKVKETPLPTPILAVPEKEKPTLSDYLSSDWLAAVVIFSVLLSDFFAFYEIARRAFSGIPSAKFAFGFLGVICGVGSVITYNRIKDIDQAEAWKWFFGILQFTALEVAMGGKLLAWESVMPLTLTITFMGVLRGIRK